MAGVELWSAPLLAGGSGLLDGVDVGGGTDGDAESDGTGTCAPREPSLVEVPFIEAQPETARMTRNPAITARRIDGSRGIPQSGLVVERRHATQPRMIIAQFYFRVM
ncbi:MAG TPA: hypothetical protein VGN30_17890, partial [Steroidobacteraceae bacterium]